MTTVIAIGTCLCKAVKIKFALKGSTFSACHCGICRKWSGGPSFTIDGDDVRFEGQESISTFQSSAWAERGFCKVYGTHLFYRMQSPEFINFSIGILENAEHLTFDRQIFIDDKPNNYEFANKTKMLTEAQVIEQFNSEK